MKEFKVDYIKIFGGLNPLRNLKKRNKKGNFSDLKVCHNIEPLKKDYKLHTIVISVNATGQDWGNT